MRIHPLGFGVARRLLRRAWIGRAWGGAPPVNDRGVTLDPQLHTLLTLISRLPKPSYDELGPHRARLGFDAEMPLVDVAPRAMVSVEDRTIPGPGGPIPIRQYVPSRASEPRPALVYLHGGGFVLGSLDAYDRTCRYLAATADVLVCSVDYRLAPEHPFPAGAEDAVAAMRWVRQEAETLGIDVDRLAIGGDSAGGNLAAVTCQRLRDDGDPLPRFQLLIYPATDLTRSMASHQHFARGFLLESSSMDWFLANYLTCPSQERDPRGSPLLATDLTGLPPAHVVVAGFDPLRDEGEAYARSLIGAGVPTTLRDYSSLVHGFLNLGGVSAAARCALDDLAQTLAQHLRA